MREPAAVPTARGVPYGNTAMVLLGFVALSHFLPDAFVLFPSSMPPLFVPVAAAAVERVRGPATGGLAQAVITEVLFFTNW